MNTMASSKPSLSVLSELEALMREEFPQTAASGNDEENDVRDKAASFENHRSDLLRLEELMRREFYTPLLAKSQQERRFVYEAFKPSESDSIRLLILAPGKCEESLSGRLIHVSITSTTHYEALSYSWGSSAMHHHLLTDEGIIPITASLRSALTRLRLPAKPRALWVDAVCINQRDNEEKSRQILLMPTIYSSASRTIVHLGQESDRSDLAIMLIEKIGKTNFNTIKSNYVETSSLAAFGLPSERSKKWKAFQAFWRRPWFRRIWIMQEFLLSKQVKFVCGDWERDWRVFLDASVKINDLAMTSRNAPAGAYMDEIQEANAGATAMFRLCMLRIQADQSQFLRYQLRNITELGPTGSDEADNLIPGVKLSGNMDILRVAQALLETQTLEASSNLRPTTFPGAPLIMVMEMTEFCEATDPRDRLFALLGLANDLTAEELHLLRPDYTKSLKWVICRYASVLVRKGHCMEILNNMSSKSKSPEVPSWICNWTSSLNPIQKGALLGLHDPKIYRAAGESAENARIGDQDDCLVVSGGLIDVIDRVGVGAITHLSPEGLQPSVINHALIDADSIFDDLISYPTGECISDVKWRTLIGNKTGFTVKEAPGEYSDQYTTWREYIRRLALGLSPPLLFEGRIALFQSENADYFSAIGAVGNYKVCKTRGGYVGLVPLLAEVGDQICVLLGGIVPFVLRESSERPGMFNLVGGCYVHGMMKGEAFKLPRWQENELYIH